MPKISVLLFMTKILHIKATDDLPINYTHGLIVKYTALRSPATFASWEHCTVKLHFTLQCESPAPRKIRP